MDKTKKHILKRAGTCVAVVLMLYLFNRLTNQAFFSQRNLTMLLKQASVLMILTSSLMLLLIETNIDLSGGAGVYLSGVTCALLVVKCGWPIFPAIVVTIMVGIMMGAVNGFFIGRIGLPAFIVTLAAQQIFRGTGYVLTDCATIGPMPKQFTAISENFIPPAISVAAVILILRHLHLSICEITAGWAMVRHERTSGGEPAAWRNGGSGSHLGVLRI